MLEAQIVVVFPSLLIFVCRLRQARAFKSPLLPSPEEGRGELLIFPKNKHELCKGIAQFKGFY